MNDQDKFKDQASLFASTLGPKAILKATVLSVNDNDTVIIKFDNEAVIDDCRLKSVVKDGNKVLLIPAVGSVVLAGRIENSDEYVVIAVDEISKMLVIVGDKRLELTEAGFLMAGGDDTLKDVIRLVIEAVRFTIVLQGRSPDYVKLAEAEVKLNNIMQ